MAPTESSTGAKYLPGLDGLRGLAVLAVIAFHSGLTFAPGGFIGVEVFFVVSGFIITAGIVSRFHATGRIDLPGFWWRRARRLMPAVLLLVIGLLSYALIVDASHVAQLRDESLAAVAYVMNWYLLFDGQSYFESFERPSLLRHLWSLGVEEQFYITWPVAMILALRFGGRRSLLLLAAAGAAASTLLMLLLFENGVDTTRLYYGTDTRAAGFLIGAALALATTATSRDVFASVRASRALDVGAGVALLAIVFVVLRTDAQAPWLYRGGFALIGLASALLIVAAVSRRTMFGRALSLTPLRWLGVRSYAVYLWHWPMVLLITAEAGVPFGEWGLVAVQAGAAVVIAAVSYALVEGPIRSGLIESAWRRSIETGRAARIRSFAAASGVSLCVLVVAGASCRADRPDVPDYLAQASVIIESYSPTAVPAVLVAAPTPVPTVSLQDRGSCDAIRGTAYRSPAERDWYRQHCIVVPTATTSVRVVQSAPQLAQPVAASVFIPGSVTAIGDSVMVGAAPEFPNAFANIYVDAALNRHVAQGIAVLDSLRRSGKLGETVVIHLGNNGTFTEKHFDQIMAIAGPERTVVFMTINIDRSWEPGNNAMIAAHAAGYTNARVADWKSVSAGQTNAFWKDGVHLRPEGAALYVSLLSSTIGG